MAITDAKKVDYLWKKLGFGAAKTDTNANKAAPNEAVTTLGTKHQLSRPLCRLRLRIL